MRDLTSVKNSMFVADTIGGGYVEFTYRLPTTEERLAFRQACLVQVEDEVKFEPFTARLEFGLKVLTGFTEGYFTDNDKPISINQDNWKELIKATASDLIEALGMGVFEGARLLGPKAPQVEKTKAKPASPEIAEPSAPLATSSDT